MSPHRAKEKGASAASSRPSWPPCSPLSWAVNAWVRRSSASKALISLASSSVSETGSGSGVTSMMLASASSWNALLEVE
jgi:hypothetical protein